MISKVSLTETGAATIPAAVIKVAWYSGKKKRKGSSRLGPQHQSCLVTFTRARTRTDPFPPCAPSSAASHRRGPACSFLAPECTCRRAMYCGVVDVSHRVLRYSAQDRYRILAAKRVHARPFKVPIFRSSRLSSLNSRIVAPCTGCLSCTSSALVTAMLAGFAILPLLSIPKSHWATLRLWEKLFTVSSFSILTSTKGTLAVRQR